MKYLCIIGGVVLCTLPAALHCTGGTPITEEDLTIIAVGFCLFMFGCAVMVIEKHEKEK